MDIKDVVYMNIKDYATQIISCGLSILRDEKSISQEDYKKVSGALNEAISRKKQEDTPRSETVDTRKTTRKNFSGINR